MAWASLKEPKEPLGSGLAVEYPGPHGLGLIEGSFHSALAARSELYPGPHGLGLIEGSAQPSDWRDRVPYPGPHGLGLIEGRTPGMQGRVV